MKKKTVLVNKPIHPEALHRLEEQAEALLAYDAPPEGLRALLVRAHGIVLGTGFSLGPAELDRAPRLEVIGRHGVGLDNVDLEAASVRGILVTYTPYGPTESTAEHALLLMLATARRLSHLDRAVRGGDFAIRDQLEAMGHELEGKILGIVGFGRIGRRLAEMARSALHMEVRVYDPYLDAEALHAWGALSVTSLAELAGQVDVLSVHAPLTGQTRHLIGPDVIHAMKPGAILINTSRGALVDQAALVEALRNGHLGGAGLDVYDPQPPVADDPLLLLNQVVLTPHVASFTLEARRRMGLTVVEDVLRALRGEPPEFLANPEVWPRRRTYTDLEEGLV